MIHLLKSEIKKFTHALQIADIHIRLNKRHDEYSETFKLLFEEIGKTPESTLVVLVGDIFHSKSDLSPECIHMATELFNSIANLRPLILVAGNHDATLANKSRLDSLTPIVDALNHPNIFYLKSTGLYGIGNVLFNNMGVFDDPEKYIRGNDIPKVYRNQYEHIVALFHGPVDQAALDTGYAISNPAIMPPLFDNHDIAMLGDIHKRQDMQSYSPEENKPCIHYVGSLIQQDHGESLKNHGFSLWNLSTRSYEFHDLPNQYGYFTIDVVKGQLVTDLTDLPKKARLRVKCYESISSEVKKVIANIKEKSNVIEVSYVRMDKELEKKDVISLCNNVLLTDLSNIDYQNKLITDFLSKKIQISDSQKITDILDINKNVNSLIKRDEFSRNLKWKPIRFEWDNMFTYGEGNVIDFTQMNGVYGVFGPNRTGKSSILSAIIFCLFDKFDRGFKGIHALNVQKSSFRCKLEFEIDGVRYFIERNGHTTRSGSVKVDVRFWKIVDGQEQELHGTARRDTNDIIRDYIGTYEDFILTTAAFQNAKNNGSFIDMGNSERKDLLVQFIGLNIFDRLYESASERNKELNALLKSHKDKNYQSEIQQHNSALDHANSLFQELSNSNVSLNKQISEVNEQIILETSNFIKMDVEIPTNINELKNRKLESEKVLNQKKKFIHDTKSNLINEEKKLSDVTLELEQLELSNLEENHKIYKKLLEKINGIKQKIDLKKIEVKGKLEKVERLKTHRYNPNCEFCVDNSFVKDANKAKSELTDDKIHADKMISELDSLREQFDKYQWVEKSYENYSKLLSKKGEIKDTCASLSKKIIVSTNELERLETSFKTTLQSIDTYYKNELAVESNIKVQSKINSYRTTLSKLTAELEKNNKSLIELSSKIGQFKSEIERLSKLVGQVEKLEYEYSLYQHYLTSIGRDGIPYQVICNTVPEIEREVNSILCQVVDFTIQFETDGKNVIPYVVYEHGRWPVELTSGYERFVTSIAIRVALINISNLPKTSALFIDEGFGTLDPDNLISMFTLFSLLKNNFDFIIVISHIDVLKDAVDKHIEIVKDGSFSKVIFE